MFVTAHTCSQIHMYNICSTPVVPNMACPGKLAASCRYNSDTFTRTDAEFTTKKSFLYHSFRPTALVMASDGSKPSLFNLIGDDLLHLLVAHITEANRPARTILRSLDALSRTSKSMNKLITSRLDELRGLPADVWEATSRTVPAQLRWVVDQSQLQEERVYSPPFRLGPNTWRLIIFPNGDDVEGHRPGAPPHLSAFVDVADAAMLPPGWVREAHFVMCLLNHWHPSKTIVRYARHDFEATARDWGFRELVPLSELHPPHLSMFADRDGKLTLTVKVWGVTDAMKLAERQQHENARNNRRREGGVTSAFAASSASSTSMGSEDIGRRRCVQLPHPRRDTMPPDPHSIPTLLLTRPPLPGLRCCASRSFLGSRRALSALRQRIRSMFLPPRRSPIQTSNSRSLDYNVVRLTTESPAAPRQD